MSDNNDTYTLAIKNGEGWITMSSDQIPTLEQAARESGRSYRSIRAEVINTNVLIGMTKRLGLKLPDGLTIEEVEKGRDALRELYIKLGKEAGGISSEMEATIRGIGVER